MPLLDLSLVTQTLSNLLERKVKAGLTLLGQPPAVISGLTISALPADKLTGDQTIGLYLYYAAEEAYFKNPPPRSLDQPSVSYRPMGLNLYYQLNAHSDLAGEQSAPRAQMLFGLALKALHDIPCIDATTELNGTPIFPMELVGTDNCFRITLQTIPAQEAPHYWTGGAQPMRLAAYYVVSVALLEPEAPSRFAGRVLRYGVHTFVRGAPRLDGSRNTVTFRVPGETVDRDVEIQPAELTVGETVRFHGIDLTGNDTTLLLKNSRFAAGVEVGATWGVVAAEDGITATAAPQTGTFDTLPGLYSASARVTTRRRMPDGSFRDFVQTSNEVPFLITPAVTSPAVSAVATANAAGVVIITGGVFAHADIDAASVKVFVGPQEIPLAPATGLSAGHFRVSSATQLRFQFPIVGLNSGETHPFRIMINGAENAPRWVNVP
jgi:Pvc16 N-terminal domain